MILRPIVPCVVLAVLAGAFPIAAQQGPAPPKQTTEVLGTPTVDLEGSWLLVAHSQLAENVSATVVELYDVEASEAGLEVRQILVRLPDPIQRALEAANAKREPWIPSAAQIREIDGKLRRLPAGAPETLVENRIRVFGPEHFASLGAWPAEGGGDGEVVLEITHVHGPPAVPKEGVSQVMADKAHYKVIHVEPTLLEGQHRRSMLASGVVPIPIHMKGPFWMHRLSGVETAPSFLERLAALWEGLPVGCGSR